MLDSISRAWLVKPMVTDFVRNVVGEIRCRVYDWKHGVHTCGNVNLTGLTLVGNNRSYGVHYHPSHPKFLLQEFSKLNIDYNQFTFIDFGAGKGRVLLAASEFPFHRIIGVEFASELRYRNLPIDKNTLVFVPALYAVWFRVRRDSPARASATAALTVPA